MNSDNLDAAPGVAETLDDKTQRDRANLFRYLRARRRRLRLPDATDAELLSSVRNWRGN
ncbi:hypothetical protein [Neomicrococcus lactis]|uniref:hypothetical protein n=1 Tax=Neomicrococcus lactis TaxID=732241 RepID=UPI002301D5FD|nr:hypothetical protein [Neomicrococcus lactis]